MIEYHLADVQHQAHKKNLAMSKPGMAAVQADNKKKNKADCRNWMSKGQCAKKDNSCPFEHNPDKKGIGKGESRGRSPTPKGGGKEKKGRPQSSQSPRSDKNNKKPGRGKSPSGRINQKPCRN